jgi:amphi-Trp domain-containing protein
MSHHHEEHGHEEEHDRQEGRSEGEVRFEGLLGREEVADRLEELARGLREGTVSFRRGEESLSLRPQDIVELELKARQKADEEYFELEVEWARAPEGGEPGLTISSEEPEEHDGGEVEDGDDGDDDHGAGGDDGGGVEVEVNRGD